MRMYIGGAWTEGSARTDVRSPFDSSVVDTVPLATPEEIETALASEVRGARVMADLPAHRRAEILLAASQALRARAEEFARVLTREMGKPITESRGEVGRAVQTLTLAAEEAKRVTGEMIPLDASPGGDGKLGFTLRVPC